VIWRAEEEEVHMKLQEMPHRSDDAGGLMRVQEWPRCNEATMVIYMLSIDTSMVCGSAYKQNAV
jgi:hypothetical protein